MAPWASSHVSGPSAPGRTAAVASASIQCGATASCPDCTCIVTIIENDATVPVAGLPWQHSITERQGIMLPSVRVLCVTVGVLAVLVFAVPVLAAASVSASIDDGAKLRDRGNAVVVRVTVTCERDNDVLEAFVYVSQDGNTSQNARIPVQCTGKARTYRVSVQAYPDQPFQTGPAQASGYILVQDRSGATASTSPTQVISIR